MDIGDILKALLSTTALHTGGHFDAASESREYVPMRFSRENLTEQWDTRKLTAGEANKIHAGGFTAQDQVSGAGDNRAMDIANSIYKVAYASGAPTMMGARTQGDIEHMERNGGKYAREAVLMSALSDLLHGMGKTKGRLQFIAPEGAPGLAYTRRW